MAKKREKKQRKPNGIPFRFTASIVKDLMFAAADGTTQETWNEIFRVGNWSDSYKQFEATTQHLVDMVANFKANVMRYQGGEIPVNYCHEEWEKAAGWIEDLRLSDDMQSLMAKIRWTPAAKQAITDEEWKYFSAEIYWIYEDQESKKATNNVLSGLALTNIPFVSDMAEARLARGEESEDEPETIHLSVSKMKKFQELLASLVAKTQVSKAEFAKLQGAALMLSDDEQSEVKDQIAEVEGKVEEDKPADASDSTEASRKLQAELSDARKATAAAHSKIDTLTAKIRESEEIARLDKLISEGKLLPKSKDATLSLLMSLAQDKADQAFAILDAAQPQVRLGEIGSGKDTDAATNEAALLSKAQELQKADPKLTLAAAMKKAVAENPALAQTL